MCSVEQGETCKIKKNYIYVTGQKDKPPRKALCEVNYDDQN